MTRPQPRQLPLLPPPAVFAARGGVDIMGDCASLKNVRASAPVGGSGGVVGPCWLMVGRRSRPSWMAGSGRLSVGRDTGAACSARPHGGVRSLAFASKRRVSDPGTCDLLCCGDVDAWGT